ncbi:MAG: type II toxin-antitoxin system Phd/YefM family antitoxin [Candidatus Accumulibacter sp.]|nr:type II toxin-antitoxin system Phd/YefM family antitoxin [Accumulibacter sp.]
MNARNPIPISEANRNFSRVARLADQDGAAVILENDVPKYVLIGLQPFRQEEIAEMDDVERVGRRILMEHRKAFEELAKSNRNETGSGG